MTVNDNKVGQYYESVGAYFDIFAEKHHNKSDDNPILTEMRESFRTYVTHNNPAKILDIGCGPGMDVAHFALRYPTATVYGLDVSGKMIGCAGSLCKSMLLNNVQFINSGIERLHEHIDVSTKFDVIYVFFGALNTVDSLAEAARVIDNRLSDGGQAVLTFVNKYYLSEFFINLLKLQPGRAMARWRKVWRGYSNDYKLHSKTYTPASVTNAFSATSLKLEQTKGYSIFYPAWFQSQWLKKYPGLCNRLRKMDKWAGKTPWFWSKGEYTLFVYNK